MASLIKGVSVILYDRAQTGVDSFGAPVYSETPVTVENVLISPIASNSVADDLNLHGKRAEYELCIPKGDDHIWEDREVEFFGRRWHTFGAVVEHIESQLPLDWNRKVKVERYG